MNAYHIKIHFTSQTSIGFILYANTRAIINCTEFKIEIPSGVSNKVLTYSHYKKGFTAKVVIRISSSGFISFKSKVAGGRKSDLNMTIKAQLVDLLEVGDEVLANRVSVPITADRKSRWLLKLKKKVLR